ncbi:SAM-dependent methyltransferase [Verrucomicrobia bacterium LW23]|nr:SAM-dependent methyltransferase [Verrucomicrobia bacterium LW23]
MRLCLKCQHTFATDKVTCPACGHTISTINDVEVYAPEFSEQHEGFKSAYFDELAQLEPGHFWFRARNELLIWTIKTYCSGFTSFLEIGCGTGFVLSEVEGMFPHAKLVGSEIFLNGLSIAKKRAQNAQFMQMDAKAIPFVEEFDAIGAFDVLEHIDEDEKVLKQIHTALRKDGSVLITVPQHQWLWSASDDYACHVRRYKRNEMEEKLGSAGFEVVRSSSFVSVLLPLMLLSRHTTSKATYNARSEFELASWLNNALYQALRCERKSIEFGLNYPIGGSRLVVAKKR